MCPLEVIRMPDEPKSIFETLVPFVQKLVDNYKQTQQTKWDNEWMTTAIADIEMANSKENVDDYILKQEMPKDIMDVEGFTKFANDSMNLLTMKEIATGGLTLEPEAQITPKAVIGAKATGQIVGEQTELMPDVKEFNELYKFVSELPTGKVDWTNSLNVFKQRLESGREMGTAAQQFLNMIMGQMMPTDQRAKFEGDVKLTKEIQETLYPKPTSDYERWLQDKESFEEFKAIGKGPTFDFKKFLKENDDWEIKTISSTGNVSVGRKDTTKKWEFDTWEEAQDWSKAHPQKGYEWKIETQGEGFNVTAMKETPAPETKKIIPTYGVIQTINEDLSDPKKDYKTTLSQASVKYDLTDPNIKLISEGEKWTLNYDRAISRIKSFVDVEGKILEGELKGYSYEMLYKQGYTDLQKVIQEYQKATGQTLQNPYLSFEEYEKSDVKPGKGPFYPSTWGKQRSVFRKESETSDDKTLTFVKEMIANGRTFNDYDPEKLKSMGIDIVRAQQLFIQLMGR